MQLLQALRNQAKKIRADLDNSQLFAHMGDRGTFREEVIRDFLRPFLPDCYGLSTGEVFSADGKQSAQIDVVLYDAVFSTVLFKTGPVQLFPAESVFGSVEVKSDLNASELEIACNNCRSLKGLARASTDILDLTPLARLNVASSLGITENASCNPYVTFAFGYRGPSPQTTTANLNRKVAADIANKLLLPDFVFVSDPGYIILRVTGTRGTNRGLAAPGKEFTEFQYLETGSDTLPLFFLTLNVFLGQIRLRSIDYNAIWTSLVRELSLRA